MAITKGDTVQHKKLKRKFLVTDEVVGEAGDFIYLRRIMHYNTSGQPVLHGGEMPRARTQVERDYDVVL